MNKKILVTESVLPSFKDYSAKIKKLWQTRWLTNNGEMLQELELKLQKYLGIKHVIAVTNGTLALHIALRALDIKGEVITTPFSFVATTTSIIWEGSQPVFVDVNPDTLNIDPDLIEKAITPRTQAIMAVHVFGNPANLGRIEKIAKKHNLKVIYDAAHAFGVRVDGQPVMGFGDISTLSFHATKVFHTIEGGALATNNDRLAEKINYLRSFGFVGDDYRMAGINAKMSEFQAAMGLLLLPEVNKFIASRKIWSELYDKLLHDSGTVRPLIEKAVQYNYPYYPVIFKTEKLLLKVKTQLEKNNIFPRRYFYPSINAIPYLKAVGQCPVSESIARRILCLPLFPQLKKGQVVRIAAIVNAEIK